METIHIQSQQREELIDITHYVKQAVEKSNVQSGLCTIFCMHTTAAITINENADPDVQKDIVKFLHKKVPVNGGFNHVEGNSDAHIKSSAFGASEHCIIDDGKLVLGTWQGIYFCEFDGPRTRKVCVQIIPVSSE